ncbi:MAG TPA: magnesium transporter [Polyangiales bacterium]|nr:magnesium transporter [Polyangiales bacterium]
MRVSKLLTPDLQTMLSEEPEQIKDALSEVHPEDIAAVIVEELEPDLAAKLVQLLPVAQAASVLERLPDELRIRMLEVWEPAAASAVLSEMAADDRADLVNELPEPLRESILSELQKHEPEVAEETRVLASYGPDTAGGIMTTEFIALGPGMSCEKAISEVRRMAQEQNPEQIYTLYVLDAGRLVGVLSLRDLILGEPSAPIAIYMVDGVVQVTPETDQEEVARTIAKYDLAAVPVVDLQGQMLGVVTVDDVVDVVIEEANEDAQKMAAVVPVDQAYFDIAFTTFVRSRVTWLVALFFGELLTANVMRTYESEIAALIDLVIFIPLIISSGGNSGSQSSSLVIRALALGEITPSDWPKVFWRELRVGVALGLLLSIVGFARTFLLGQAAHPLIMGIVVATSLVAVVTLGTLVGALMPLLIKRIGLDPAVSSTPFVASLVDVFGLVVYFTVSRIVLGVLL